MSKRTAGEEVKYQATLKQDGMRNAFAVLHDLMKARDIEYPFAVIWQTHDENGNQDYTVMRPSDSWDVNHGRKAERMGEIVHDHIAQTE